MFPNRMAPGLNAVWMYGTIIHAETAGLRSYGACCRAAKCRQTVPKANRVVLLHHASSLLLGDNANRFPRHTTKRRCIPRQNQLRDWRRVHVKTIGLLGTRFTMEERFYRGRLEDRHGLTVLVPSDEDRECVHHIIYHELCQGQILKASELEYRRVVSDLVARGCEGVILGCTEIGLLLVPADAQVPLFDTAEIHAERAALYALREDAFPVTVSTFAAGGLS